MKRTFLLALAVTLVGCGGSKTTEETATKDSTATEATTAPAEDAMQTYSDPQGRFKIQFPANWEVKPGTGKAVVTALSPMGDGDNYAENVSIETSSMTGTMSPKQIGDQVEPMLKGVGKGYEEVSRQDVTIHGVPGTEITFKTTYDNDGSKLSVQQRFVALAKAPNLYMMFCTATPDSYASFSNTFDKVVNSFEVTK